ncbi:SDR family NAD(P)-dependent oxidoreductase [Flavobacterium sp. H122]|uniref:SDR family NAD(P)-dependent oxidoreductase n=1 Tax=Flavobacterium sp. H122 TaxID=2529860 RepID=UPI0010A9D97A|nr:SDR family NAD(P)-dependent oxidoreductase [Flavobacterium sp. H122]
MKTVVITGANRGIGLALVNKFLTEGFMVIGTSRKDQFDQISHPDFHGIVLDVTSSVSIHNAVSLIKEKLLKIDLLINSAGVGLDLNDETPEIDIIKTTFETNVFGLFSFTEAIKDYIVDGGTIFNISSVMGMLNRDKILPNATAYRMSKSALNMYTKTLSARLAERKIKVVSIHPGWVKTDMGGQEADVTPEFCANGIYQLYLKDIPTNSFWAADTQTQLNW